MWGETDFLHQVSLYLLDFVLTLKMYLILFVSSA